MSVNPAMRLTVVLALAVLGGGCSGLLTSSKPFEQWYSLRATTPAATAGAAELGTLLVARPMAHPGLNTHRIALTLPGNRFDYFAASRWAGPLPQVLGAMATETLGSANRFALVIDGERGIGGADFELSLIVRHFEAEYVDERAAPVARVALECLLTTGRPRRVLGRCDSDVAVEARDNRMGAVVVALEAAAQQALAQVSSSAAALAVASKK
jgi:ABC-type uncharacterized transport system auxiliary subunit